MIGNSRNGFTFIETIIYVTLFSVISTFVVGVFYQLLISHDRNRTRIEVDQEANFIIQKMHWALTGAESISSPSVGATSTSLTVDLSRPGENLVTFDVDSGNFRMTDSDGVAVLNSSRVSFSELLFTGVRPVENYPAGVSIKLVVISLSNPAIPASTTIENTIYLKQ